MRSNEVKKTSSKCNVRHSSVIFTYLCSPRDGGKFMNGRLRHDVNVALARLGEHLGATDFKLTDNGTIGFNFEDAISCPRPKCRLTSIRSISTRRSCGCRSTTARHSCCAFSVEFSPHWSFRNLAGDRRGRGTGLSNGPRPRFPGRRVPRHVGQHDGSRPFASNLTAHCEQSQRRSLRRHRSFHSRVTPSILRGEKFMAKAFLSSPTRL